MLKTRILLVLISALVIGLIFLLPKVVVENEQEEVSQSSQQRTAKASEPHMKPSEKLLADISRLRAKYQTITENEKNAIFADSLSNLYEQAGKFDSAAWFAEEASAFFNTMKMLVRTGDLYYQAYTFALDQDKQNGLATKSRAFYERVLKADPKNLDVKTKMAMTYVTSENPMQGITMLREVLEADPKNELALFNLGMLSIQSGQYGRAVERLEELVKINPKHTQGQLLLGIALMNTGEKKRAKEHLLKVKDMDKDPAVQATVDSYLEDLK